MSIHRSTEKPYRPAQPRFPADAKPNPKHITPYQPSGAGPAKKGQ